MHVLNIKCLQFFILACLCFTGFCYAFVPFSTADVHFPSSWLPAFVSEQETALYFTLVPCKVLKIRN